MYSDISDEGAACKSIHLKLIQAPCRWSWYSPL